MGLIAALEEAFDISFETDDIVDFSSFKKGKEILSIVQSISELDISFMVANQSITRNYNCPKLASWYGQIVF